MSTEEQIKLDACEAACDTLRQMAQQLWKKLNTIVNDGGYESYFNMEAAKDLLNEYEPFLKP